MVWIGCWSGGLIYKIFEENERMNSDRYIETIKWFHQKLEERDDVSEEWRNSYLYQQDNAPPHVSLKTLRFMNRFFGEDRIISKRVQRLRIFSEFS